MKRTYLVWLAVVVATGLALGLRLWGNDVGLPYKYAADEWTKVEDARALAANGFQHTAMQPSFLYNTLWLIGKLGEPFEPLWRQQHPLRQGAPEMEALAYYLWLGRCWMAVLGAATVPFVYWLGAKVSGRRSGVVAALLYAVTPLPVIAAHYIKEDTPLALGVTASLVAILRLLEHPTRKSYVIAGLCVGFATALKFPAIALFGLIVAVHVMQWRDVRALQPRFGGHRGRPWYTDRRLWGAAAAVAAGFVVLSPNGFFSPIRMVASWATQGLYLAQGHHDGIAINPWEYAMLFYVREALLPGLGWPVLLAAVVGGVVLARRQPRVALVVVGWTLGYYLMIECSRAKPYPFFARYALPIAPTICVLAGVAVTAAAAWLARQRQWWSVPGALPYALAVLLLVYPTYLTLNYDRYLRADTRDEAQAWIESTLPRGARVVYSSYSPYISALTYAAQLLNTEDLDVEHYLTEDGPVYFVISSFSYERYLKHPDKRPDWTRFLASLFERGYEVQEFQPRFRTFGFSNPTVKVLKLERPVQAKASAESGSGKPNQADAVNNATPSTPETGSGEGLSLHTAG